MSLRPDPAAVRPDPTSPRADPVGAAPNLVIEEVGGGG
jgi:hypothetical protein